jgi:N-alpha-acetyl-L-2,4-diaminobutyrate deacetylase
VRRLLERVGGDFAGRILAMPVANPPTFQAQSRHSPIDSEDLDHVFPGSATSWVTHRIAHHVAREVIAPADLK